MNYLGQIIENFKAIIPVLQQYVYYEIIKKFHHYNLILYHL